VPVLFLRKLNEKLNNNLLSFASGVMLAATLFSLLLPSDRKYGIKGRNANECRFAEYLMAFSSVSA
jgi:zinc transporter ZupT